LGLKQQDLFGQSPSASETSSVKPSSESTGPTRPSTRMSEPSRQMSLGESTSYAEDFPVSPGVKPGSSEALKMTVTSGRKCCELLKLYKVDGSLARMSEALLTRKWASNAAYLTWKASGIKPPHLLFQLAPSMPRTEGIASGLLPTAQAWDGQRGPRKPDGKRGMALSDLAAPHMWPTPATRDHKGANSDKHLAKARGHHDQLPNAVKMAGDKDGQLNPAWVEWLMGFPEGWTDLKPSATPSSPRSSSKSEGQ